MQHPIRQKKAMVTGGTRGIGRAIAKMLLDEGAQVVICGRDKERLEAAVKELQAETQGEIFGQTCDLQNENAIPKFFEFADDRLGSLDILVNNAGIGAFAKVGDMESGDWERTIATNLTAVFHCSRLAIKRFRAGSGGFVVNIGSLAGKNAFSGGAAYNASKFGLLGFGEALLLDHRQDNVRLCTVMPGSVATDFGPRGKADWKIQPEDVAEVVRMVLSMPERTMVSRVEMRPSKPAN